MNNNYNKSSGKAGVGKSLAMLNFYVESICIQGLMNWDRAEAQKE
ncbi:MAG: hypothetical protein RMX68_026575 [Aulosira sp. ZfuVER01]|nr:hypothetical protein [Aulosira sp. ZfuVER01]MDZ7999766.1 hypothetical protein [Aulosira sp. DedVER01a]MDZ8055121.1 hypothetical protein [Aulosira sp. ZfuCHP01]